MMFKVGDVIKIKPFCGNTEIGGIYHTDNMTAEIGNIHVVLRRYGKGVYGIDDGHDYFWSEEVFEPAVTDQPIVGIGCVIRSASYSEDRGWITDEGVCVSRHLVGLAKKAKIYLPYEIYGVGEEGEEADVLEIQHRLYLDPRYLPMSGIIKEKGVADYDC